MRHLAATAAIIVSVMAIGAFSAVASQGSARPARYALPRAVPSWTKYAVDDGPAGARVVLPFRLYLAGHRPAAESAFATAVSTPGSKRFRDYLSPAEFGARFGPTARQVEAVESWARGQGLKVTGASAHYVGLSGGAPTVSRALATSIRAFGGSINAPTGYAPVKPVSVPASLRTDVLAAVGLDDDQYRVRGSSDPASRVTPAAVASASPAYPCSSWWGQHSGVIPPAYLETTAPTAVCGYTPSQLRSAYGVGRFTGKGATIAVVLDGRLPRMEADANRFFAAHQLPGFAPGQYHENVAPGFAASCAKSQPDLPEEPLDVETVHIIAPDAKVVYVAANCSPSNAGFDLSFLDAATRIVDRHLADVETDSYSILESTYTPAVVAAWSQTLEQGATEGIGFNFDAGDGGDNTNNTAGTPSAVTFPASDPWATAVGGTTLQIGRSGQVVGELGWGDTISQENGAGTRYVQPPPGVFAEGSTGGRSELFAEPSYQLGIVPRALATRSGSRPAHREVPDVAADASPITGWQIGYTPPGARYEQIIEGGTSGSSPIIAALEADAEQASGRAVGFANPTLYALRKTAAIRDVTVPRSPEIAVAPRAECDNGTGPQGRCLITLGLDSSLREAPGYDDVTGVGAATKHFIALVARAGVDPR